MPDTDMYRVGYTIDKTDPVATGYMLSDAAPQSRWMDMLDYMRAQSWVKEAWLEMMAAGTTTWVRTND